MKTLLTGATGFVGSLLVDRLQRDGHQVHAFVRASSRTQSLRDRRVLVHTGSLESGRGLPEALDGIDAVAHLAGGGKVKRTADFYRHNADTTEQLLRAVERYAPRVRRFVHVSSLSAHGPSPDGAPRDPSAPCEPVSHYGRSKALAESRVMARQHRLPVSIIRPPAVYGPGDTRMVPLFSAINRFGALPLIAGRHVSMVWGPDCADAIALALASEDGTTGRVYCIEDGAVYTHEDVARLVGRALGKRVRCIAVPTALMSAIGAVNELQARIRGVAVPLTRDKVLDMRQEHWMCSSEHARRDLGWEPTLQFAEGAALTARWYQERGWL